ncbi:MAG: hypothetical protein V1833_00580 [Elusimicrobiota bacterium]
MNKNPVFVAPLDKIIYFYIMKKKYWDGSYSFWDCGTVFNLLNDTVKYCEN